MPLDPHSERPELGAPDEYREDHPDDRPSQWGWHGEWGRGARVGGWIVAIILLLMLSATHYNFSGGAWLIAFASVIVLALAWDAGRRRNTWRK